MAGTETHDVGLVDNDTVEQATITALSPPDSPKSLSDSDQPDALRSREASLRVADDNGEPPPITKAVLLGLIAVYFSVFLDMMGISIVQPVLPFYAEEFGANSFRLGALYSSYSFMATIASFAMGKASDKFGRRPCILFSLFGTMVGFTVTGLATNYGTLLAYRFLTGAFGGSAPIAQAYITDVVPSSQRPKYLALTGATAALSFIIGPGIGSGLSTFGIRIPFFVSGGLGGAGLIFAYFVLQESHPRITTKKDDGVNVDDIEAAVHDKSGADDSVHDNSIPKEVWILAFLNVFNMMGWTSYTAMFAYYVILKFGISALAVGYITLSLATLYVFTNVITFSQLSKHIGVYMCTFYGLLIFSLFLGLLPLVENLWYTLICIGIGAGLGNGLVMPSISAMSADFTNPTNRGKILAFSNAAQNVGMVIGPLFHGIVYEIDPDLVFYSASAFVFCAWLCIAVLVAQNPHMRHAPKLKVNENENFNITDAEDWKWVPDKPTQDDYIRLGKYFGKLLSKRQYNWVSHFDPLTQFLKDIFPPLRTTSLQEHIEDISFIKSNISNMRSTYDTAHAGVATTYS